MLTRLTGFGHNCLLGALAAVCTMSAPLGCSRDKGWPLETVSQVDVARYAGTWYEIASYPHMFQRGCRDTHAQYTPTQDGRIKVKNTCQMSGREVDVEGWAEVPDAKYPGRLAVHLNVPVVGETEGQYYIVALDEAYQWAVVGHPNRQYLWILSRKPALSPDIVSRLLPALETASEYKNVRKKLRCTQQSAGDTASCEAALLR